ncbi:MAG: hypothetical protein ACTSXU_10375, partial [Promethearchaeota archaeon]
TIDILEFMNKFGNRQLKENDLKDVVLRIISSVMGDGISKTQIRNELKNAGVFFKGKDLSQILDDLVREGRVRIIDVDNINKFISRDFAARGSLRSLFSKPERFDDFILKIDELLPIFNLLYDNEILDISIECAPFGHEIYRVSFEGDKLFLSINKKPFTKVVNDGFHGRSNVKGEIFKNNEWREVLIAAGIIKPKNLSVIQEKINETIHIARSLNKPTPLICIDTNLFRNRFYTLLSSLLNPEFFNPNNKRNIEGKKKVEFLLSDKVREELNYDKKFSDDDIFEIKKFIREDLIASRIDERPASIYKKIIDQFFNQNTLIARKKRIGFEEFLKCKEKELAQTCKGGDHDARSPDYEIITGVQYFIEKNKSFVLMLSADHDFSSRAQGIQDLTSLSIKYPKKREIKDKKEISWDELKNLIYCAATWHGAITINQVPNNKMQVKNKLLMIIFGIWKGKDNEDWRLENLKIEGSEMLINSLKRDVLIARDALSSINKEEITI